MMVVFGNVSLHQCSCLFSGIRRCSLHASASQQERVRHFNPKRARTLLHGSVACRLKQLGAQGITHHKPREIDKIHRWN